MSLAGAFTVAGPLTFYALLTRGVSFSLWGDGVGRDAHTTPASQVGKLRQEVEDLRVANRDLTRSVARKEEQYDRERQKHEEAKERDRENTNKRRQLEEDMDVMRQATCALHPLSAYPPSRPLRSLNSLHVTCTLP